jgi:hypothetical protein
MTWRRVAQAAAVTLAAQAASVAGVWLAIQAVNG